MQNHKYNYFTFTILSILFISCQPSEKEEGIKKTFKTPKSIEGFKRMLLIPEGRFMAGNGSEVPNRELKIAAFYMDEVPVAYQEFEFYVAAGGDKSAYWAYESYHQPIQPVTGLSWYHAADFCNWRSIREGLEPAYQKTTEKDAWGHAKWELKPNTTGYRLPTEAEFEYAARGGLQGKNYPWGNDFQDDYANYDTGRGLKNNGWWRLANVTEGKRNAYGLYNMSGNIWHWCNDWYGQLSVADSINPQGATIGRVKSLKGGSWGSINPEYLKVYQRSHSAPSNYNFDIGFRCVRSIYSDMPDSTSVLAGKFYQFYQKHQPLPAPKVPIWDFNSPDFAKTLAQFLADNYPNSLYFIEQVDEQPITTPEQMVADIMEVAKEYKVNPLFLTSIMISESGLGSCSFPRWYNNPMAYHWQNKLMPVGLPSYKDMPNKRNRKYKTLKDAYKAFCRGIRRPWYFKASRQDLYAFHRVYVGYEAEEWMITLSRVYKEVAGMRLEPHSPAKNVGVFIYTDWVIR